MADEPASPIRPGSVVSGIAKGYFACLHRALDVLESTRGGNALLRESSPEHAHTDALNYRKLQATDVSVEQSGVGTRTRWCPLWGPDFGMVLPRDTTGPAKNAESAE